MKTFEVGGCVRDRFLNKAPKDIDRVVVLEGFQDVKEAFEHMVETLEGQGYAIFQKHPESLTVRARAPKGKEVADFVLARRELYSMDSRIPQTALGSLWDDQARRDLTINTMALGEGGALIDPFNGLADLKNKILRTPLDPWVTFLDDPLRVLRVLRFSITLGFDVEPSLWEPMLSSLVLEKMRLVVSQERIQGELNKMFAHDTLKTLRLLALLDAKQPDLLPLFFDKGLNIQTTFKNLT